MNQDIYYLPCENCGYHNEVKSEYLVFCGKCNKKMSNSYTEWKTQNPGQSFEIYINEVCISENKSKTNLAKEVKSKRKSSMKYWIGVTIGALLIVVVSLFVKQVFQNYFFPSLEQYAKTEWTMQDCGSLGLQIKSPLLLQADHSADEQVKQNTVSRISGIESYTAETKGQKLMIMANSIRYNSGIESSLQGAVKGSLQEIQKQQGVSGLKFDIRKTKHRNLPGSIIEGKWKQGKRFFGFRQVVYVKKNVVWQVLVVYDLKDRFGEEIAEGVIRSVVITPNIV